MGQFREALKKVPLFRPAVQYSRRGRDRLFEAWRIATRDRHTRRLRQLRNVHKGRRAFVVGNGPSLNKMNLDLLAGEVTFCVNSFYLMYDRICWKPTYYVVEDCFVAEDNAETLNRLQGSTKLFGRHLRYCLEGREAIYFNEIVGCYPNYPQFSDRADLEVFEGGTVTYINIQLAAWMGCNPIYLIGTDMSYKVPDYMENREITSREADVNHFHPDYFGPGKRWHDPQVDRMIRSIDHAGEHLKARGVSLCNATAGGKLEVLPRVEFQSLFASEMSGTGGEVSAPGQAGR
jgi:hypothetical protein